jgi:hypothetical protein
MDRKNWLETWFSHELLAQFLSRNVEQLRKTAVRAAKLSTGSRLTILTAGGSV